MKYILCIIVACAVISCSSSQRITYLQVPAETKGDTVDVAAYEKKYGKYDGVFLIHDESIEHSGTSTNSFLDPGGASVKWEFHRVVRHKYVVLNPDNQELTTFELGASARANIGTLYLLVASPTGTITRF